MKTGIYKITNIVNNKFYIGSAKNILARFANHKSTLKYNKHNNEYLQLSYNKYGVDNFKYDILEECSCENLIIREQFYIDNLQPDYNICKIAYSRFGCKHSEESKLKISSTQLGKPKPLTSIAMKGKVKDRYTIEQIIKANNKAVLQFDKQGNFIKEWVSIREASNTLNIKHSCISNCCSGRHKTAGKFIWKLKNNN